ncbi:MAG: hypothetical protein R2860_06780 [Desulfobacterales bacterium]
MALSYNINIIAGSVPELKEDLLTMSLLSAAGRHLGRPVQAAHHPGRSPVLGLKGGDRLRIFDTDVGKIGYWICDVEFPELSRHLVDKGMTMLFVPY